MEEKSKPIELVRPSASGRNRLEEPLFIISHLVAASLNNVIGKNSQLPWNLPNDFKYFKNKTWGMPVIMGRKTFESLEKQLPGRFNIIVTTRPGWRKDDVIVAHSINEALIRAKETDCKEIFIIGGAEIFKQSIEIVNRIYLTRVQTTIEGDAFYPEFDKSEWKLIAEDPHEKDERHAFAYTFQTWEKAII